MTLKYYDRTDFHEKLHERMQEIGRLKSALSPEALSELDKVKEQLDKLLPQLLHIEEVMLKLELAARYDSSWIRFSEPPAETTNAD